MRLFDALALCAATMISSAGSATPPATGQWGGDRAQLTLGASGGRIEYDCGAGTIDGPVQLDAEGRFNVKGKYEAYASGPTVADAVPATKAANFRGKIDGDRMSLSVQLDGDKTAQTFNLVRGQRVKLVRCL